MDKTMKDELNKQLNKILKKRDVETPEEADTRIRNLGFISTTIPQLDELIGGENGVAGIPRERITELSGAPQTGKSLLAKRICTQEGIKALYIDTESAWQAVDSKMYDIPVVQENIIENIWGVVNDCLDQKLFDIIVIDSVAGATTVTEFEADVDVSMRANLAKASALTNWMHQIAAHLKNSNTAILFINHLKTKVGVAYSADYAPGGEAIPFTASLRVKLYSGNSALDVKKAEAKVRAVLEKNRFGPRKVDTTFKLLLPNHETFAKTDEENTNN